MLYYILFCCVQVFKPHVQAVTGLAFDSTGETLATGSADGTVFFFNVTNKTYSPIGFVPVAGPVTHLSWSPAAYVSHHHA